MCRCGRPGEKGIFDAWRGAAGGIATVMSGAGAEPELQRQWERATMARYILHVDVDLL